MPNIDNANGYNLRNLNRINIIMGKNGCGKSTLMRSVETTISQNLTEHYQTMYITPERGGFLVEDVSEEQNLITDRNRLSNTRRNNQFNQFKQQAVYHYRLLKEIVQDEIELIPEIRQNANITFETYLTKINTLLDNIELIRDKGARTFVLKKKAQPNTILTANNISSGESELIALGIECLVFEKRADPTKRNILFLDEPDVHLHPDLQDRLAKFLHSLVEGNVQLEIIISTHSTALLSTFADKSVCSLAFMKSGDTTLNFECIDNYYKTMLPVFGAHPLSQVFNSCPLLLVEGEDDVRIWQQAIRTAQGKITLYPVSTDTIDELNRHEVRALKIITSVYDNAKAFSLRDRDDEPEAIDNLDQVIRFRLSCRNAESLIVSNEVLAKLGTNWQHMQQRIETWLADRVNNTHQDYGTLSAFRNGGFARKTYNLKDVRNVLIYLSGSKKPWEVAVGQAIGEQRWSEQTDYEGEGSLLNFLGKKLVENILPKSTTIGN